MEDQPVELRTKASATDEIEKEVHHVHQIRSDVRNEIHHDRGANVDVQIAIDVRVAFHRLPTLDEDSEKDQEIVERVGQCQDEERNGDGD